MAKNVYGTDIVIKNLSHYRSNIIERIKRAVTATQAKVTNDARHTLRPGYGYITGNLQRSIQPGGIVIKNNSIQATVEANAEYASFVELGTSRQAAKPFLAPAVFHNREYYRRNISAAVKPRGLK